MKKNDIFIRNILLNERELTMCLAVPMKIMEIVSPKEAVVDADGISMNVSIQLLKDVHVGDYVIVHTGFAIEVLDREEAEQTIGLLNTITELKNEPM